MYPTMTKSLIVYLTYCESFNGAKGIVMKMLLIEAVKSEVRKTSTK
jgi:hypothetical protein